MASEHEENPNSFGNSIKKTLHKPPKTVLPVLQTILANTLTMKWQNLSWD